MKLIKNIAKLAAVGLGAALLGASAAFGAFQKSDVFNTDGSPKVSAVVWGANAQAIDGVYASNVAQAIADTASRLSGTTTTTTTTTGALTDTYTIDDYYMQSASGAIEINDVELDNTEIDDLYKDDITYKDDNGDSTTLNNVKELLRIEGDVYFNEDADVDDVTIEIGSHDLNYTLDLAGGIHYGLATSDDHDVTIPFLGEDYEVLETGSSGDSITLVRAADKKPYKEGDSFALYDEDGKRYTVNIAGFLETGGGDNAVYKVTLELVTPDGTTVSDTRASGEPNWWDDYDFTTRVNIVDVYGTIAGGDAVAEIILGDAYFEIEDGEEYDADLVKAKTSDDELWTATLVTGTTNSKAVITDIVLRNTTEYKFTGDDALKAGEEAFFPLNFASVRLKGFEDEDKDTVTVEMDGSGYGGGEGSIKWTDEDGDTHEVALYYELDGLSSSGDYAKFTIDDQDYYIVYTGTDDFNLYQDSYDSDDADSDQYTGDGDADATLENPGTAGTDMLWVEFDGYDDDNYRYGLTYNSTTDIAELWFLGVQDPDNATGGLAAANWADDASDDNNVNDGSQFTLGNNQYLRFIGTDDDGDAGTEGTLNTLPVDKDDDGATVDDNLYVGYYHRTTTSDDYVSVFRIWEDPTTPSDTNQDGVIEWFIDPAEGRHYLIDTDEYSHYANQVNYYGAATATYNSTTVEWSLDQQQDNDLRYGVTDLPSWITVDGGSIEIVVSNDAKKLEVVVGAPIAAAAEEETTTTTTTSYTVPVKLDSEAPTGTLVVVGGQIVNTIAADLGLADSLQKDGDYVADVIDGHIVLAGWLAADTGTAVDEFIDFLNNLS